jgi:hypothetical protein
MSTLTQASYEWATRKSDERFTSLYAMRDKFDRIRAESRTAIVNTRTIEIVPTSDNKGLSVVGKAGVPYAPSNWAFGQLSQLAEAPAGYLRTLPAPMAADCLNYGLKYKRDIESIGLLLHADSENNEKACRSANGEKYGRIWNNGILQVLTDKYGDGATGDWRVPGEFRVPVPVTKENTTLYAGDRDMFVFLANESNQIEICNRRDGKPGSMARGFFVWNSEVGAATFGFATFLYDYCCKNRMIWGADQYQEIKIRHTATAPERWLEEIMPALETYGNASSQGVVALIESARAARLDDVDAFLAQRFGKRTVESLKAVHMLEESRPIETVWDAVTAVTAQARSIPYQNERVELERKAGDLLKAAA